MIYLIFLFKLLNRKDKKRKRKGNKTKKISYDEEIKTKRNCVSVVVVCLKENIYANHYNQLIKSSKISKFGSKQGKDFFVFTCRIVYAIMRTFLKLQQTLIASQLHSKESDCMTFSFAKQLINDIWDNQLSSL